MSDSSLNYICRLLEQQNRYMSRIATAMEAIADTMEKKAEARDKESRDES